MLEHALEIVIPLLKFGGNEELRKSSAKCVP